MIIKKIFVEISEIEINNKISFFYQCGQFTNVDQYVSDHNYDRSDDVP